MNPYYPIFLNLVDKLCVIVGGGKVAERKIKGLLAARARVRVVSPGVTKEISRFFVENRLDVVNREYRRGDLEGGFLAFAATDNEDVNRQVREEASHLSLPINVVTDLGLCDFVIPSLVRKDPILIALSTSGLLPSLSKKLRREILERLVDDYPAYARRVRAFREYLIENVTDAHSRRRIMKGVTEAAVSEVAHMSLREIKERFLGAEGNRRSRLVMSRRVRGRKGKPTRRPRPKGEDSG
jgi:precorrin-2 dehydrogenase / sirohydrochlorin ferrochelatase